MQASLSQQSQELSTSQITMSNQERHITRMLLTVSIAFLILKAPTSILRLVTPILTPKNFSQDFLSLLRSIGFCLLISNYAINCPLYYLTGSQFREQCNKLLRCRCRGGLQQEAIQAISPIRSSSNQ